MDRENEDDDERSTHESLGRTEKTFKRALEMISTGYKTLDLSSQADAKRPRLLVLPRGHAVPPTKYVTVDSYDEEDSYGEEGREKAATEVSSIEGDSIIPMSGFRISLSSRSSSVDSMPSCVNQDELEPSTIGFMDQVDTDFDWYHIKTDMKDWEVSAAKREAHCIVIDFDLTTKTLCQVIDELNSFSKACKTQKHRSRHNAPISYLIINNVSRAMGEDNCPCRDTCLEEDTLFDLQDDHAELYSAYLRLLYDARNELTRTSNRKKGKRLTKLQTLCELIKVIHSLSTIPRTYKKMTEVQIEGLKDVIFVGLQPSLSCDALLRYYSTLKESGTNPKISYVCPRAMTPCDAILDYRPNLLQCLNSLMEQVSLQKDPEVEEEDVCTICMVAPRNTVMVPCGHAQTCASCGDELTKKFGMCPICRTEIVEVVEINND